MAAVRVEIPKCQQLRPPETLRRRFHTTKTQSGHFQRRAPLAPDVFWQSPSYLSS
jgi:hypothetical protein